MIDWVVLQGIKALNCLVKILINHLFLKLVYREKKQAGRRIVAMSSQVHSYVIYISPGDFQYTDIFYIT